MAFFEWSRSLNLKVAFDPDPAPPKESNTNEKVLFKLSKLIVSYYLHIPVK